ncbi:spore germination protein GerW family protein [Actinoplanes sp. NPDC024001]|uniref:spore germination protein GerW family protein n=1 Tax=Actinoplanes sp. NPDC024001 TaxID=3154598 RepID=UPI0033DCA1DD
MTRKTDSSSDILERARSATDTATAGRVFGTPVEKDGVLILPVAVVSGGGGGGSGSGRAAAAVRAAEGDTTADDSAAENGKQPDGEGSGGGFGFSARPAGVYVIKNGSVSWQPAVDVNKIVAGGQLALIVALLVIRSIVKKRRHH